MRLLPAWIDLDAQSGGLGRDGFPGSGVGLARCSFTGIRRELAADRFQRLAGVDRVEQVTDHEGGKAADAEEDVVIGERVRGGCGLRQRRRFRCPAGPGSGAGDGRGGCVLPAGGRRRSLAGGR